MVLPAVVQCAIVGSVGSAAALTWASACLVIGWEVRMFERFCLDGWPPMRAIQAVRRSLGPSASWPSSAALTVAAALVSPTAWLHQFTGLTLLLGYCHVRSLDAEVLREAGR